ncbi:MAG: hypothetical protein WCK05_08680 [Planctomycetota bacterium]
MTKNSRPNILICAGLALALLIVGGCAKKYEHKELALDGEIAKKIVALVDSLQKSASDEGALKAAIRDQLAPGLAPNLVAGLESVLADLAKAKQTKLVQLDRFGKVLRASFHVTGPDAPGPKACVFLLTDETPPRWIKPH